MEVIELSWEGCLNIRDLGGHPTEDGTTTRHGVVVRGDDVGRLTTPGWEELVEYGVRTIIDLRRDEERVTPLPGGLPVTLLHLPVVVDFGVPQWEEFGRGVDPPDFTRFVYAELLRRFQERFGRVISVIATAEERVLVHCQSGKDRTGIVVALLLRLAGVGVDTIAADYARTAENLSSHFEAWFAEAPDEDTRVLRTRLAASRAESMLGVLEELDDVWGGAESYLLSAGTPTEHLEHLRQRLRVED
jgi:protein tyrosine/serine phosphatase